jgi:hypothetical protein
VGVEGAHEKVPVAGQPRRRDGGRGRQRDALRDGGVREHLGRGGRQLCGRRGLGCGKRHRSRHDIFIIIFYFEVFESVIFFVKEL